MTAREMATLLWAQARLEARREQDRGPVLLRDALPDALAALAAIIHEGGRHA